MLRRKEIPTSVQRKLGWYRRIGKLGNKYGRKETYVKRGGGWVGGHCNEIGKENVPPNLTLNILFTISRQKEEKGIQRIMIRIQLRLLSY